jgi:hypothetical protein
VRAGPPQHIVEGLRDTGLTNLLIVVGWRADVVKEFFGVTA